MEQKPNRNLQHHQDRTHLRHHERGHDFSGLDVEKMSPIAHVTASLAAIMPIVVALAFTLSNSETSWLISLGWAIPAFGLLLHGREGLSDRSGTEQPVANGKERELLGTLREYGELTPSRAVTETSSTVAEVDGMLKVPGEGLAVGYGRCVRGMIPIPRLGRRVGV